MAKEEYELFAVLTYYIWNSWKAKLFDCKDNDPMSLVSFASGMLSSFKEANSQSHTHTYTILKIILSKTKNADLENYIE